MPPKFKKKLVEDKPSPKRPRFTGNLLHPAEDQSDRPSKRLSAKPVRNRPYSSLENPTPAPVKNGLSELIQTRTRELQMLPKTGDTHICLPRQLSKHVWIEAGKIIVSPNGHVPNYAYNYVKNIYVGDKNPHTREE